MFKFLKVSVIFSIFLSLFFTYFHPISAITQDLGRHILLGKIIVNTRQVPKINLLSYTYPGFPFINHHWLSEVAYYLIVRFLGFNFLLIISTLTVLASFLLVFLYAFKKSNIVGLAIASILYISILFERTDIRPEIFSFLFLSIFITLLYSYREKITYWIFILIPLELLWTNMHIYFVIGIAVIGLFLIDGLIIKRKTINCRYIRILTATLILSSLSTLINPNGIKGALYPFYVFQNYGYTIQENQNIFFLWNYSHDQTILFFALSSVILFIVLIFAFKKTRPIDWFLSIFFTIIASSAIRNLPLFVFATFIAFSSSLSFVTEKFTGFIKKSSRSELIKDIVLGIFIFLLLWQIKHATEINKFGFGLEKGADNAVNFFLANNLKGPIFNNFDVGSYLEYRLYPKEKLFVDGRPEAFPTAFFQTVYIPMQENLTTFNMIDQKYKFNLIFFSYTDQTPWAKLFLQQIVNNGNWKIIYLDDYSIILAKDNNSNENLINKFAMDQSDLRISNFNPGDFNSLVNLSVFFNNVGWINQEIAIYEDLLSIKPDFCPAIYNLANILIQQESPAANIYVNRFNSVCK